MERSKLQEKYMFIPHSGLFPVGNMRLTFFTYDKPRQKPNELEKTGLMVVGDGDDEDDDTVRSLSPYAYHPRR